MLAFRSVAVCSCVRVTLLSPDESVPGLSGLYIGVRLSVCMPVCPSVGLLLSICMPMSVRPKALSSLSVCIFPSVHQSDGG